MSDFAIDSVDSISGFTYVVENTSDVFELQFGGAGSRFDRISSRAANFDWNVQFTGSNTTNYISIVGSPSSSCDISVSGMNPQDPSAQETIMTIKEHLISCSFNDGGFNNHATNYNTVISKTIYSVDSYDGNDGALCLVHDTIVELEDGTEIEIGDLIEGDELIGYNIDTLGDLDEDWLDWKTPNLSMEMEKVKVKSITFSFSDTIYNINNGEIRATYEHPLLVLDGIDDMYRFKEAGKITKLDKLVKEEGIVDVVSIEVQTDETVEVVSIDVETQDTYVVNGYINHNKGGNTHTGI